MVVPLKRSLDRCPHCTSTTSKFYENNFFSTSCCGPLQTNLNDTVILSPQDRHTLMYESTNLSEEAFLARVAAQHSSIPMTSPLWQVERVRFARLPHTPIAPRTTFIDVSLSMKPLLLRDLECIVHSQCFNTEDLAISLDARSFQAIGLTRSQVRLGDQQCMFSESNDGRWVRKLLLMDTDPEAKCGTRKFSQGKMVTLSNTVSDPLTRPRQQKAVV